MSAITDATATESAATGSLLSEKWITKVIVAVILGEAIWAFVVSLTNSLILPGLARAMGGNPQSPLYLGKGDFNVPAIFSCGALLGRHRCCSAESVVALGPSASSHENS